MKVIKLENRRQKVTPLTHFLLRLGRYGRGVQAIILKFRGNGKFRSTPKFADEIENGELLSPQKQSNIGILNVNVIHSMTIVP